MPTASGVSRYDVPRGGTRKASEAAGTHRSASSWANRQLHLQRTRPHIASAEHQDTSRSTRQQAHTKAALSASNRHSSHDRHCRSTFSVSSGEESNTVDDTNSCDNTNDNAGDSKDVCSSPDDVPVVVSEEVIQRSVQTFADAEYVRGKGVRAYAQFHNTIEQLHMTLHAQLAAIWRTSMQLEKPLLDAIRCERGLCREDVIPAGVALSNEATCRLVRQEEVLCAMQSRLEQLRSTSVHFAANFLTDAEKRELGANPAYLRSDDGVAGSSNSTCLDAREHARVRRSSRGDRSNHAGRTERRRYAAAAAAAGKGEHNDAAHASVEPEPPRSSRANSPRHRDGHHRQHRVHGSHPRCLGLPDGKSGVHRRRHEITSDIDNNVDIHRNRSSSRIKYRFDDDDVDSTNHSEEEEDCGSVRSSKPAQSHRRCGHRRASHQTYDRPHARNHRHRSSSRYTYSTRR